MADANSVSKFMEAQQRARRLIQMDANGTLDNVKKQMKNEGKMSYDENGYASLNINETAQHQPQISYEQQIQSSSLSKSKLPKEIVESFKVNQIDTSLLGAETSILDRVNAMTNGKLLSNESKKQTIKENAIPQQQTNVQQPIVNQAVDYSMIKMIVEDCMRRYTSALKKQLINESKSSNNENTLQAFKVGKNFSFIDSKGNLYEASLKFIKNLNDKQ